MSESVARRPKESKVDPNESRTERFVRLSQSRGEKLIHQLKLLNNLGTSYAYRVDPELAEELLEQFETELASLKTTWTSAINKLKNPDKEEVVVESE